MSSERSVMAMRRNGDTQLQKQRFADWQHGESRKVLNFVLCSEQKRTRRDNTALEA